MFATYMYNIQYVDLQPIHWGIYTLVYDPSFHIEHFYHKDHAMHMDLCTDYFHRLCCLGIQSHVDILLFWLKKY